MDAGLPGTDAAFDDGTQRGDGGNTGRDGGHSLVDAGPTGDACARMGIACDLGQRCDDTDDVPRCENVSCDELSCGTGQDCRPLGSGFACVDAACATDVDCAEAEYCDGSTCRMDVCTALVRTCDGDAVLACDAVGGGEAQLLMCGSGGYFDSACMSDADGQAACACEGDWDCPAHTTCEVDRCVGTGAAPTCTLPPVDFADVPPALELHWGGDDPSDTAHDGTPDQNAAPWPSFTHVLNTPVVANLDDDNGDGLINELDFPEILFASHKGNNPWRNAVVRAIHGGGPNKGADYFARCGDLLWTETAPIDDACADDAPTADAGAPVAVGDLDYDGVPEIVVPLENDRFQILSNRGEVIYTLPSAWNPAEDEGETIAIANLDHAGYAELIVGPHVFVLGDDAVTGALTVTHQLTGQKSVGINSGVSFMACPADLDPTRAGLEIAVGTTLYALPVDLPTCAVMPCTGALDVVWHAPDIAGQESEFGDGASDGYCAVADVWGADYAAAPGPDNRPDGMPEVILIANGYLVILDGQSGALIDKRSLGGARGGAPNVDDFDGDGFVEVASALEDYYIVADLQTPDAEFCPSWDTVLPRDPAGANVNTPRDPGGLDGAGNCNQDSDCHRGSVCGQAGTCVCLHNGWHRASDDNSSRATSSSVFDFNGDGSAEVVYNDECELRVYRGADGTVLYNEASRSRTGIENPVVADVDNDGNAEIVVGSNNAVADRCDEDGATPTGVNGLRVFGDPTDTWVSARRVWNQQSYHVTNVTEAAAISRHEAESWRDLNGRLYNTYRSQPRSFGVAPDLAVTALSVSAAGGGCITRVDEFGTSGTDNQVDLSLELRNLGDLRVGPGVLVTLHGIWDHANVDEPLKDSLGAALVVALTTSLEPTASLILSLPYDIADNAQGTLPDHIRAVVDGDDAERECDESNNSLVHDLGGGDDLVDLRIEVGDVAGCPDAKVTAMLYNDGAAPVEGTLIHWYAGDPSQGGTRIGETRVEATLPPGGSLEVTGNLQAFPARGEITVYGVVDPNYEVGDCARANNKAPASAPHACTLVLL